MLEMIRNLLRSAGKQNFSQTEREAIVDLMVLIMFADSKTRQAEKDSISTIVDSDDWESKTPFHEFFVSSMRRALAAWRGTEDSERKAYIARIHNTLGDDDSRKHALDACKRLIKSDREVAPKELEILEMVDAAFKQR